MRLLFARKSTKKLRHLYDIFKLLNYVEIDEEFVELMMKVREHRKTVGRKLHRRQMRMLIYYNWQEKYTIVDFMRMIIITLLRI